jgi:hypothetical protein
MRYLIQNPNATANNGTPLIQAIIEHLISRFRGYPDPLEQFPELVNSLDHDGYILDQKGLRRKLPNQIAIAAQENELSRYLPDLILMLQGVIMSRLSWHIREVTGLQPMHNYVVLLRSCLIE